MKKIKGIRSLFNRSSDNNQIVLIMFYLSYPLVILFEKLRITPNMVTFFSLVLGIVSILFLIIKNSTTHFMIFFFISQLLDYADGTLARKTNNINKSRIDVDHLTDVIKIFITLLGIGYYFNLKIIWILVTISLILYSIFIRLNSFKKEEFSFKQKNKKIRANFENRFRFVFFIYQIPLIGYVLKFTYRFLTTLHGQTILTFMIAPLNEQYCLIILSYFIFVATFNIFKFK